MLSVAEIMLRHQVVSDSTQLCYAFRNILFLTKELRTNKVIPSQFSLFSTAANESRKVLIPVEPVNHSAAKVTDGRISFVVNVIRKNTIRLGITERKKK